MSEGIPDTPSPAAADGTLAHAWCAQALLNSDKPPVPAEWVPYVASYVAYVRGLVAATPGAVLLVERPVPLARLTGEIGAEGTPDAVVQGANILHVIDLKFGAGELVSAGYAGDDMLGINPQLGIYALALLAAQGTASLPLNVVLHIFQPRREHVSTLSLTLDELRAFGVRVRAGAKKVVPGAPLTPGATQCRWCRARATCRARADWHALTFQRDLNQVSNDELAVFLAQAPDMARWIKDLHVRAFTELQHQRSVGDWKVVEGRGSRVWLDGAREALQNVLGVSAFDSPVPQLIGITAAEKLLGKKHEVVVQFTHKPRGSPKLVPGSDPRPPLAIAAGDEFSPTTTE
jgi:hypothetical protein